MAFEHWQAALAASGSARADILVVGDSWTEGDGASTPANRWIELLQGQLRTTTGGVNYRPLRFHNNSWSSGTNSGATYVDDIGGPGIRQMQLDSGDSFTFPFTGTGCDILYLRGTIAGAFTWAIDGGATTTVTTTNATNIDSSVVQVRGLTSGSHSLRLARSSGSAWISGVRVYDGDETAGVGVFESGRSGATTSDIMNGGLLGPIWADVVTPVHPSLVVVELGGNDIMNTSNTPTTIANNMLSIVNLMRAKISWPCDYAFMLPPPPVGAESDWATAAAAIEAKAATDGAIEWIYLDGVVDLGNPTETRPDGLHPTDYGHTLIASHLADLLGPAASSDLVADGAIAITLAISGAATKAGGTSATLGLAVANQNVPSKEGATAGGPTADLAVHGSSTSMRTASGAVGVDLTAFGLPASAIPAEALSALGVGLDLVATTAKGGRAGAALAARVGLMAKNPDGPPPLAPVPNLVDLVATAGWDDLKEAHDFFGIRGGDDWHDWYSSAVGHDGHLADLMYEFWSAET